MTTPRTPKLEQEPWTPFDSDLEFIVVSSNGPTLAQTQELRDLHCLRDGYLECYRTLVTPLLAAMEAVLQNPVRGERECLADISSAPCTCGGHDALAQLRDAIEQAKEGAA